MSKYLPVFTKMQYGGADEEEEEQKDENTVEVQIPGRSRFFVLKEFNGIPTGDLLAAAKKDSPEDPIEQLRNFIVDYSISMRKAKKSQEEEEGSSSATQASSSEHSEPKSHSGFIAKVCPKPRSQASPTEPSAKPRGIRVVALTKEGLEEKKKLLKAVFETVLSFGARLKLEPEEVGQCFVQACPDEDDEAGGPMMGTAGMGGGAGGQDAMAQAMMQQMMGGLGQAMGGGAGPGMPPGGTPQTGGAQPDCKQQ